MARTAQLAFRYGQEARAAILAWAAVGVWLLGNIDEADRMLATAIASATESRHVNTQGFVFVFGACVLESLRAMLQLSSRTCKRP